MNGIEDILRKELTPDQFNAATDMSKEVLCLACAGSGKSTTLAYRIAWLVAQGAEPASIVAFTFTDKAADAIKLRVSQALERIGLDPAILGAMYVGTIHSYCQYTLCEINARYRQFDVLDENRLKLYSMSRFSELGLEAIGHRFAAQRRRTSYYFWTMENIANAWQVLHAEMHSFSQVEQYDAELGAVLRNIDDSLDRDNYIDFSLMIRLVVDALQASDPGAERAVSALRHLMVDEYQDVNPLQEALIRELHRRSQTLFVVGDDDQAIYAWRGADVNNILTFPNRYSQCARYTLAVNFRSTPAIVETADNFAATELGATRYTKNPTAYEERTPRDYRVLWFGSRQEEAEWVAFRIEQLLGTAYQERDGTERGLTKSDFAILMRSTRQPEQDDSPRHAAFTRALHRRGISYSLEAGGSIFDREEVAALRSIFELLRNSSPTREVAQHHFNHNVVTQYPDADFRLFAQVLRDWGVKIHSPTGGTRIRLYPQQLLHDLLHSLGLQNTTFDSGTMQDIGMFSRILQDVEMVYMSIDSTSRFQAILNFLQNVAERGYDTGTDEVVRRPDAVTVSTVHKMKGLEFPVVFVVDVEAQRFPGRRYQYDGWLPPRVIQDALSRGAYQSTRAEEARLFFTAVTRAERYIYISGSQQLPGGVRQRKVSPFTQRLSHAEIITSGDGLPEGIAHTQQRRRINESIVPTSYSDLRYYLKCPKDYQLRKRFGFSPPVADLFGFGQTLHASVCRLHQLNLDGAPTPDAAEGLAREVFHIKHVPQSRDPENSPGPYERARERVTEIVRRYSEDYASDFSRERQVEARFEIPLAQAVISGSIDLLLKLDNTGRILEASVIDFKSMEGGSDLQESEELHWTELALQVQLYAKAAREVLCENARTGAVHLLGDNQRVFVPVTDDAVDAAIQNIEWAVDRIIHDDFPMRPQEQKCTKCDFRTLCSRVAEAFRNQAQPPPVHVPSADGTRMIRAFSEFDV